MATADNLIRCDWCLDHPLMMEYHDTEWGVPVHDDRKLFEFLVLDAAQAGLSWRTVLLKRENYRKAFDNFDAEKVARYHRRNASANSCYESRHRPQPPQGPLRSHQRPRDAPSPGRVRFVRPLHLAIRRRQTVINRLQSLKQIPATSKESDAMSKDMKQRGFTFCGSTICYAFMQAAGMVNDHIVTCFRHGEVQR